MKQSENIKKNWTAPMLSSLFVPQTHVFDTVDSGTSAKKTTSDTSSKNSTATGKTASNTNSQSNTTVKTAQQALPQFQPPVAWDFGVSAKKTTSNTGSKSSATTGKKTSNTGSKSAPAGKLSPQPTIQTRGFRGLSSGMPTAPAAPTWGNGTGPAGKPGQSDHQIRALGAGDYDNDKDPLLIYVFKPAAAKNEKAKTQNTREADGSTSTEDSKSFSINGKKVLLPQVWYDKNGKEYYSKSDDETLKHYQTTGESLGAEDAGDLTLEETLDRLQMVLDAAGMVPVLGNVPDGVNALISLARGDYKGAALSAISMIPIAGLLSGAGKLGKDAYKVAHGIGKAAKYSDEAAEAAKVAKDITKSAKAVGEIGETAEDVAKIADKVVTEDAGKNVKFSSLDDYINSPKKLGEATPEQLYKHLQDNGFNPSPLSGGNTKEISFEQGGGFKVNWGGDRILQYHPAGLNHHGGGAYFKISSGPTGTLHFDLSGNPLPPIRTK